MPIGALTIMWLTSALTIVCKLEITYVSLEKNYFPNVKKIIRQF